VFQDSNSFDEFDHLKILPKAIVQKHAGLPNHSSNVDHSFAKSICSSEKVLCPVCNVQIAGNNLNFHLPYCLTNSCMFNDFEPESITTMTLPKNIPPDKNIVSITTTFSQTQCPICSSWIHGDLQTHVDTCISNAEILNELDAPFSVNKPASCTKTIISNSNTVELEILCRVCKKTFELSKFNAHLC